MKVRDVITRVLNTKGEIRTANVVKATGLSRAYVHRVLHQLQREGKILLVGKANRARYIRASERAHRKAKAQERTFRRRLLNKDVSEDAVLEEIKRETGILENLPENVRRIVSYGFTEMLNNAREHSRSKTIMVDMHRTGEGITFSVMDRGMGIFRNIMRQHGLQSELEAIQGLLKGKQTTSPEHHSGKGIFFTSKAADLMVIKSSRKRLIFDNRKEDIFVKDVNHKQGTTVEFLVSRGSKRELSDIFTRYTGESYEFGTTEATVNLYIEGGNYVSRSQGRRIMHGVEKFKKIILDFKGVETIGQGFADEVFCVWQQQHKDIKIEYKNANENTEFMIKHILKQTR